MKRWLCFLMMALLLAGCAAEDPSAENTAAAGEADAQTSGLYDPENEVESNTAGAVRAYSLIKGDFSAIVAMGEDYLLFGQNTLTVLTGDTLVPAASLTLEDLPAADSGMIQVNAQNVVYFSAADQAVVWLDKDLREISRLQLSETVIGSVYLTQDGTAMYYCTEGAVRVMNLQTGMSQLLKEQSGIAGGITGGLFGGQILRCSLEEEEGTVETVLISGQTGQTLARGEEFGDMRFGSQWYFLPKQAGWFVGEFGQQAQSFLYREDFEYVPLPQIGAVVGIQTLGQNKVLYYYDLDSGLRSGAVWLKNLGQVSDVTTDGQDIWFTCGDCLYRWSPELSPSPEQTVYTQPHYTREDPDEEGLAALQLRAEALAQRYGVEIRLWEDPRNFVPWDYSFETEYLIQPLEEGMNALEKALAGFPEGFFTTAARWTDSGVLKILLVRGIYGSEYNMNSAAGMEYLLNGDAFIALSLGDGLEQSFYHTMGHLIDTVVLSNCSVFYEWDELNPGGFRYDNDYLANENRDGEKYLKGSNRYFIDTYSMSFAVEDRARILEYACMPGNEEYFTSKYMQAKLKRICKGIRQAFGLKDDPTRFLWEQYLDG